VHLKQQQHQQRRAHKSKGFTLVEMMVALGLLGILGVVAGGFLLPMRMTSRTNNQSSGLTYARSYLEMVKNRWLELSTFKAITAPAIRVAPNTTPTVYDIEIPSGWTATLTCSLASNATIACDEGDQLRTVTVTITVPNQSSVKLSTLISRPSNE
jgi:prepilin-type N-terminal cleavage/methylation domain-containing protein